MKSSKIIILILVLGILYLGYDNYRLRNKEKDAKTEKQTKTTQSSQDSKINLLSLTDQQIQAFLTDTVTGETGEFIPLETGRRKYEKFRNWNRRTTGMGREIKEIEPYAWGLGKRRLKTWLERVSIFNAVARETEIDTIVGLRLYLVMSEKREENGNTFDHLDLMTMPVFKGGKDVFDLKPDVLEKYEELKMKDSMLSDGLILNATLPCPNNCGGN